jgi:hypothetical protein
MTAHKLDSNRQSPIDANKRQQSFTMKKNKLPVAALICLAFSACQKQLPVQSTNTPAVTSNSLPS